MIAEAQRLHSALVAAFSAYTTEVFAARGYPMDRRFAEAIEQGSAYLDAELAEDLERPFTEQRRSPLEVFRTALGFVAATLADAGAVPPDTGKESAAPDDPYVLAPGSSSVLGPEAHAAHIAWGTAKAAAFIRKASPNPAVPTVLLMSNDPEERSVVRSRIEAAGTPCTVARNPGAVAASIDRERVVAAAVDLSHPSARDSIGRLVAAGITTIAYDDAPDDLIETGLRAAGVRSVVRRKDFVADPGRFLPSVV